MTQLRQGDVFIIAVEEIPKEVKRRKRENDAAVLAWGEVTGHKHQIRDKRAELYETEDGRAFLQVKERDTKTTKLLADSDALLAEIDGVVLSHEEHTAITIPNGTYEVRIQQSYTDEGFRPVLD